MTHWKELLRASGIHLSLSLAVAAVAGLLVFTDRKTADVVAFLPLDSF